ncbi:hypothetical protein, partial [Actinobacillus pleuropneumoniae]|uniref:hypothetical protein n=1 Tax=Actinobacillus pleuropneumoniae TaxID=715 RepID=UPI003B281FE8
FVKNLPLVRLTDPKILARKSVINFMFKKLLIFNEIQPLIIIFYCEHFSAFSAIITLFFTQ